LIREDFLHYLWKYKYFAIQQLETCDKRSLQIFQVGQHNLNSGPDFFNAKLQIGEQLWAGNVEIHVKASDWYVHHHEIDPNYDNVILHVVWENDMNVFQSNSTPIPTLELNGIVSKDMLANYIQLFSKKKKWINCENQITTISSFVRNNWLEKLFLERIERKSDFVLNLLQKSSNDWESVLFQMITMNFGLKVNKESFLNLANSVDFRIVRKQSTDLMKLESLFFGQAGFLQDELHDAYYLMLKKEYNFIKLKYQLEPIFKGQFYFFRLRPNNFPSIRLAQLAGLYYAQENLFSKIIAANTLDDFYTLFDFEISPYWRGHYNFASNSTKSSKRLTKSFIDLLLINTIIPLKFTYLKHIGRLEMEEFIQLAKEISPENNGIITVFKSLPFNEAGSKINIENAFESQAYLQLKNTYCDMQNCLQCAFGNALLKA
jgi:hypothetical protein